MCGRYVQTKRARDKARLLALREGVLDARPESWNVAPSTLSLVVRNRELDTLTADWLVWGLSAGPGDIHPINARVESAATKFTFREAWKSRRCLVSVDGWYEWKSVAGRKQPYYFYRRDGEPICFAGLWSGESFCLVTTAADGELATVHDRRPLSVIDAAASAWILGAPPTPDAAIERAIPSTEINFHPVSPRVSSARNDGPDLVLRIEAAPPMGQSDLL